MKSNFFIFLVLFISNNCFSQRYLTPIFSEVQKTSDIQYGNAINYQGNNESLLLDFYEPKDDTKEERPLIIYAHGGGFTDVNQTKELIHIAAYCDSMASRGYVVASINYRLDESISNRAVINAMHDMKAAIRFFKKEQSLYKIDTSLVFLAGESAGAVTALNSNYINQSSETSFPSTLPMADDLTVDGNSGNAGFSSKATATLCYCGGTATVLNDLMFDVNAMEGANDPPLLQVHGTADPLIPIAKALEVSIQADAINLPYLFYTFEGATHCPWFYPLDNSWNYLDTLIDYTVPFLYAVVDQSTSVDEMEIVNNEFQIFPNPSNGSFTLDVGELLLKNCRIEIFNTLGQMIEVKNETIHQMTNLNLDLQRGIYYMRLNSGEVKSYLTLQIN